jgi:hypothetical protein
MYPNIYICVCVCVRVLQAYTCSIQLSVYVRIGRGYVCVHLCAMVMDRLCAHASAGSCCALGLKPETLNRASPYPWTACGFGAQAFYKASAFNANIGAWNTASITTLASVCAAPGPAARTMAGRARPGLRCGVRPVVRGGTADARARAHTCRPSLARGLGCRYGRAEGRFDTCIRIYTYRRVCVLQAF